MRLIDADKAVKQINEWLHQTKAIPLDTSYHFELLGCVENCPTIDAVPVVRGEWEVDEFGYKCSACDEYIPSPEEGETVTDAFCRNCGARMDGNSK